jgi:hypothetical protein
MPIHILFLDNLTNLKIVQAHNQLMWLDFSKLERDFYIAVFTFVFERKIHRHNDVELTYLNNIIRYLIVFGDKLSEALHVTATLSSSVEFLFLVCTYHELLKMKPPQNFVLKSILNCRIILEKENMFTLIEQYLSYEDKLIMYLSTFQNQKFKEIYKLQKDFDNILNAIIIKNYEIANYLMELHGDFAYCGVNLIEAVMKFYPVEKHMNLINCLIFHKHPVQHHDLVMAVCYSPDCVSILIKAGADPNISKPRPLEIALSLNLKKCVDILTPTTQKINIRFYWKYLFTQHWDGNTNYTPEFRELTSRFLLFDLLNMKKNSVESIIKFVKLRYGLHIPPYDAVEFYPKALPIILKFLDPDDPIFESTTDTMFTLALVTDNVEAVKHILPVTCATLKRGMIDNLPTNTKKIILIHDILNKPRKILNGPPWLKLFKSKLPLDKSHSLKKTALKLGIDISKKSKQEICSAIKDDYINSLTQATQKGSVNDRDSFGELIDEIPDWKVTKIKEIDENGCEHIFCLTLGEIQNLKTNPFTGRMMNICVDPKLIQRYNVHEPEQQYRTPNQQRKHEIMEVINKFEVYVNPNILFELSPLQIKLISGMMEEIDDIKYDKLNELLYISPLAGTLYMLNKIQSITQMSQIVDIIDYVIGQHCLIEDLLTC